MSKHKKEIPLPVASNMKSFIVIPERMYPIGNVDFSIT